MQERYGIYVYINAPAIVDVVIIVCLKKSVLITNKVKCYIINYNLIGRF